ncbi:alanine racemase [Fodinicola acaciae]|uniref:alanine racemase n=1 Tax=Fodinicola acaciae TaxID=2681555 RepID=UPI001651E791|nr:alanine racemase [Fodinicola acaciae]
MSLQSEARVDLAAIRANVATVRGLTSADVMAVVKADGYGHGLVPAARAALAGGASWLGVATLDEALAVRAAGITAPVLAWLIAPKQPLREAIEADVELSVATDWLLEDVVAAAAQAGRTARVQLKVDTGLGRGGAGRAEWPELVATAAKHAAAGAVEITAIWSHFARADEPGDPSIVMQQENFGAALAIAKDRGVDPPIRHLANTAATLTLPEAHYDLVRVGIGMYGYSPIPGRTFGLRPAMTMRGSVAVVKRLPAGHGISYGHIYTTSRETTVALVPLGYGDGIPRQASNIAPLWIGGRRHTISGRVCMDQFVVDVGDLPVDVGDDAVLFGPGDDGEPTADDWAAALDTISYEIVTRVGARVPRTYVGEEIA